MSRPPTVFEYLIEQDLLPQQEGAWFDRIGRSVIRIVCRPGEETELICLPLPQVRQSRLKLQTPAKLATHGLGRLFFPETVEKSRQEPIENISAQRVEVAPTGLAHGYQICLAKNLDVVGDGRLSDVKLLVEERAWQLLRNSNVVNDFDSNRLAKSAKYCRIILSNAGRMQITETPAHAHPPMLRCLASPTKSRVTRAHEHNSVPGRCFSITHLPMSVR
jgi:hypothetical protein